MAIMTMRFGAYVAGMALLALAVMASACGADNATATRADDGGLRCGAGTIEVDHQCVVAHEASDGDSSAPPDAAVIGETGPDAEKPIHALDPCSSDHPFGGCYQNNVYDCERGSLEDPGRVTFNPFRQCSVLGGTCVAPAQSTGIGAYCKGGGYTPCSPSSDPDVCADAHVLKHCDSTPIGGTTQTVWAAQDCRTLNPAYVCKVGPTSHSGCLPP